MYQPFRKKDFLAIALACLILLISFWLFSLNKGRFYNPWG
ncbi:hypothetical protein SRA_01252 [Streptococcus ratti FA-1 = DSM 20564]|uniref:Uncharacterized protein n=1 Tax=Streptococcus ratti FA-1 = DSM 20564 TaxID=699248 RepID=A0ABN0GX85_STRRT|nr:hypothetical protein SRA_01252 [Streptococcus ratti FA-1 = DSM 20564]